MAGIILLVFAACQSDELANGGRNGEVAASFSVQLPGNGNNAVTRAATAGDGTSVNRCIMEIYLNDELYSRQIGAIQPDGLTAGFDIRLVTSQTYKFVFWADHVESVEGDAIKDPICITTLPTFVTFPCKGIITEAVRTIRGMLSLPVWRSW
mgnify:CR=1 FL=1